MSRRPGVFFDIRHSIARLARSLAGNALNSPLLQSAANVYFHDAHMSPATEEPISAGYLFGCTLIGGQCDYVLYCTVLVMERFVYYENRI
jgi:hypothetical protein